MENIAVVELGSILEIEVQAEGVPSVAFQWFKLPPGRTRIYIMINSFYELKKIKQFHSFNLSISILIDLETSEDIDEFEESEWIPLEVKTRTLRIENFRLSDIGSYR